MEPAWLTKLNELYTPERFGQIKNYWLMTFAIDSITDLDEAAYRESQRITRELNGISESRSDEYYAYRNTQSVLWNFVDQMYVKKYCTEEMKQDVKGIMEEVVAEYKKMLRSETWLSKTTRQKAINKLNHLGLYSTYPDKWVDWSTVDFASRAEGGCYQEAYDAILEGLSEAELGRVNADIQSQSRT